MAAHQVQVELHPGDEHQIQQPQLAEVRQRGVARADQTGPVRSDHVSADQESDDSGDARAFEDHRPQQQGREHDQEFPRRALGRGDVEDRRARRMQQGALSVPPSLFGPQQRHLFGLPVPAGRCAATAAQAFDRAVGAQRAYRRVRPLPGFRAIRAAARRRAGLLRCAAAQRPHRCGAIRARRRARPEGPASPRCTRPARRAARLRAHGRATSGGRDGPIYSASALAASSPPAPPSSDPARCARRGLRCPGARGSPAARQIASREVTCRRAFRGDRDVRQREVGAAEMPGDQAVERH